jgi:hypothetical protein
MPRPRKPVKYKKFCISLSPELCAFIEGQRQEGEKTSAVIARLIGEGMKIACEGRDSLPPSNPHQTPKDDMKG